MFQVPAYVMCCRSSSVTKRGVGALLLLLHLALAPHPVQPSIVTRTKAVNFSVLPPSLQASDAALPSGARLQRAIVIFRDAARLPLSRRYVDQAISWAGLCDFQQQAGISLVTPQGASLPPKDKAATQHKDLPGGCPLGVVSKVGHRQAVEFGSWLRSRYVEKLLETETGTQLDDLVYARSTYHNRTLVTLQGVLEGLAPGAGAGRAASEAKAGWKVVVRPNAEETLYANAHRCKALGWLLAEADKAVKRGGFTDDGDEGSRDAALGIKMLVKLPPQDAHGWLSWKRLLDAVMCLEVHNQTLYRGLTNHVYQSIDREATKRVAKVISPVCQGPRNQGADASTGAEPGSGSSCQHLLQLSIGPLVAELRAMLGQAAGLGVSEGQGSGSVDAALVGERRQRLMLLSGHDSTLMPLLSVLGRPLQQEWPPFMANLILELWQLGPEEGPQHYAVRALYNMEPVELGGDKLLGSTASSQLLGLPQFLSHVLSPFLVPSTEAHRQACEAKEGAALLVGQLMGSAEH